MMSRAVGSRCCRGCLADMALSLERQAVCLVSAFVLGAALGLAYDLIRPLRRRSGRVGAAIWDIAFALISGLLTFSFAMGAGSGRLGVWELFSMLLGFCGYMHTLSDSVYPVLDGGFAAIVRCSASLKNLIKKIAKLVKILFRKVRKWIIINE